MPTAKRTLAALLALAASAAPAEVALFDDVSGQVTIPSVSVGASTYVNVTLQHIGNLVFTLQSATEQVPRLGPGSASYDLATGVLSIPDVLVGCTNYVDVRLANIGNFSFTVLAATPRVAPVTVPLAITTQPANVNIAAGQAASFSVQAGGTSPFSYQWRRNGVDIPGATAPVYSTPALSFADNGALYSVLVSNAGTSEASANAVVAVVTGPLGPGVSADPVSFTAANVGGTPTLSALTTGFAPTYQWRRNGLPIAGATSKSHTLQALGLDDDGAWFSIQVCNAAGCVTSANAQVQVARAGMSATSAMSAANNHSLALRADGSVWGWGQSLGGTVALAREATAVPNQGYPARAMCAAAVPFTDAVAVAGGYSHSLVVRRDGTAWATGSSGRGQLGRGTTAPAVALVPVLAAPGVLMQGVRSIATGTDTSHAITADSQAWAWGNNQYQQLGDGTATDRLFPVRVRETSGVPFTGVVAVRAGTIHTLWLKTDGSVWAAGFNSRGQIGDGSGLARANPVPVKTAAGATLTGVTAISAGASHNLALLANGTAVAWGYSNTGALANNGGNSQQPTAAPVRDATGQVLSGIVAVEAGEDTSYFLLADGTLLAAGAVAIGNTAGQPKPVPMRDAAGNVFGNVQSISAHYRHALAIRTDGTVWGWGNNVSMNLADGTSTSRSVPVRVGGLAP